MAPLSFCACVPLLNKGEGFALDCLLLWLPVEICHSTCRSSWSSCTPGDHFPQYLAPGLWWAVRTQDRQGMFLGMSWLCGLGLDGPDLLLRERNGLERAPGFMTPRHDVTRWVWVPEPLPSPFAGLLPEQRDYIAIPPIENLLFCEESCSLPRQK